MAHLYVVPTALLAERSLVGQATAHATTLPDAPQWSLLCVEHWHDLQARDAFERASGVTLYPAWSLGQIVPAALAAAAQRWGVRPSDTLAEALAKVRAYWPAVPPD
jgi:hypothetical protein